MGIFSFGKKDDTPTRRGANTSSTRAARGERVERRATRRTERPDADAMLLDPTLPEKQRARRRLVGAIAMVVAAVVILPMVLDSHPKPVTDDIAIDIPTRPAPKAAAADEDTQAGVAPDNPAPDSTNSALAASGVAPAPAAPAPTNAMTQQGTAAAPAQAGKSSKSQASAVASTQVPASKKYEQYERHRHHKQPRRGRRRCRFRHAGLAAGQPFRGATGFVPGRRERESLDVQVESSGSARIYRAQETG
jgi:DedD protein